MHETRSRADPPQGRGLALTAFLAFLPMAVIGTLAHEAGHWTAATAFGLDVRFHYASVGWIGAPSPQTTLWVTAAGPLQTLVTGCFGLWWLETRRRGRASVAPDLWDWVALLLALFWSRPVFNAGMQAAAELGLGHGGGADEVELSLAWGWRPWTLGALTGALGLFVCARAVLRACPAGRRAGLVLGGASGALAGYGCWYGWLGPVLLP